MPIEFQCSACGQTLNVPDEYAGRRAKCPKCQSAVQIPELAPQEPAPPPSQGAEDVNPYAAPHAAPEVPTAAPLGPTGELTNVPVETGTVLSYAWEVWKQNLGILVGIFVVIMVISYAAAFILGMAQFAMEQAGSPEAALLVSIVGNIGAQLLQLFLTIGQTQITLKLARGQQAEFGELFGGGSRFLSALGVWILLGLAIFAGLLCLIVPGIILMLFWWPCYLLVIDDKSEVMESFGTARMITRDNVGTTFVLWLCSVGIMLVGLAACCVGIIAAAPLVTMMWVTAYLMMSGQIGQQPEYA